MTASDTIAALGNARYLNGRNQLCLAQGGFFSQHAPHDPCPGTLASPPPPRRLWPMHIPPGGRPAAGCKEPAGETVVARARAPSRPAAGPRGRACALARTALGTPAGAGDIPAPLGAAARRPRRRPGGRKIARRWGSRSARGGPPKPPPVQPPSAWLKGPMRTLPPIRSYRDPLRRAPRSCGAPPRLPLRTARPPGRAAGRPGRIAGGHALATAHSSTFLNTPSLKRSVSGCV